MQDLRDQLDRANRILVERENEMANVFQKENNVIQNLRNKLEVIEEDKKIIKVILLSYQIKINQYENQH